MEEFKYKVSVIVPVYNAEEYLTQCLESLVSQTVDLNQVEILLIDDGSLDTSLEICKKYAECYPFFKVFTKDNEGVSATRNLGIAKAKGKYIMYLDADDMLTNNTLDKVLSFFDQHYDEVDIVTYPERTYLKNGTAKAPHIRYQTLKETGIYDANRHIYMFQVRLNIAIKNKKQNNIKFDISLGYHEDQKYCNDIIREKMKLGFVKGCEYQYMLRDNSITDENTNPINLFTPTTSYWEELFSSFDDNVPKYYQALFMHDLSWKLSQNCLLPYHYHGEKFKKETNRLWKLLEKVELSVILKHPSIDNFHRFYFIQNKGNNEIVPIITKSRFALVSKGKEIFGRDKFELIFNKCKCYNNKLLIQCTLKSQFFNFYEQPNLYVCENELNIKKLDLFFSSMSYYKCKTITNNFWGFYYICDMEQVKNFKFLVQVDGIYFNTYFYMMPASPFVLTQTIIRDNYKISLQNNNIEINNMEENYAEINRIREDNNVIIRNFDSKAYTYRKLSEKLKDQTIWLYYDCKGVDYDNGYLQFIHDINKKDNVVRYYILNNDFEGSKYLFHPEQYKQVVEFGSDLHKSLFLRASKIITAFIEEVNIYPFNCDDKKYYMDIINSKIIYLQHGILHASLPWKYTPEKVEVDKVVASSQFEINNFRNKYCFREEDILPYGMPRFEKLDLTVKPGNHILFAPSWRMYLIGECVDTVWGLREDKFLKSKYYEEIRSLLNSKELRELLESNDLYLDFKIHPIFKPYLKYFDITSERICISDNIVKDEEYCMFITDFSSYVFNFAYLKRPIVYFVPDYLEFEAGLNQYRRLDLPFEKGFGEFTQNVEDTITCIKKTIKNQFGIEDKYKKRMDNFFISISDSSEKIYQYLITNNDEV